MNKKILSILIAGALLLLVSFQPAYAQTTLTSTTLSSAITDTSGRSITVASATGFAANSMLFVDQEAMVITSVSGTVISVVRGSAGTKSSTHLSGATVYVGVQYFFSSTDRSGSCTSTSEVVLPVVDVSTGYRYPCTSSMWLETKTIGTIEGVQANHLRLNTVSDDRQIRINSRNFVNTSGNAIGFQVKPAQAATSTGQVIGGEISPRMLDGFGAAGITGLHVDVDLKGTTAVTSADNVKVLELELVTSNSGARTISGYVTAIRIRAVFSATAITGNMSAIRIEKPEAQTNSQTYDAVLVLTSTVPLVWNDTDSDSGDTEAGYIKVIVNGNARYIVLYSDAPST